MNRLSANTRTVVKRNYALITEDSYVSSTLPGWQNVDIRVVINPAMGANLSQHLIKLTSESLVQDETLETQVFFYVIEGSCKITINKNIQQLTEGGFVYIPIKQNYQIEGTAKLVAFYQAYQPLNGHKTPKPLFGNSNNIKKELFLDDPQLHMQYLLPDDLSMDFAVNIFTYNPGGNLPFVETHIMEHGLLYLQGEGIYRLDNDWYHVTKGDSIWMAPYCPQWFTAMGKQNAIYIYCKNVNRPSISK